MARGVYILGGHPMNGHSMGRYTSLLSEAYSTSGFSVRVLRPSSVVSRLVRNARLRKLLVYMEKLVIFPMRLWRIPRDAYVHIADHSDGIWLLNPFLGRRQVTVTCHDLFAIQAANGEIPEHRPKLSGRLYQWLIDQGLRKSSRFIAVSHTTRLDVLKRYPNTPVSVVSNPVADAFLKGHKRAGQYALIVGTVGWRKRREVALEIWVRLRKESTSSLPLIIVGPDLTVFERQLLSDASVELDEVKVLSDIDESLLVEIYAGAECLILASKYEGFAWPIVEANAVGVPALCADTAILRETGAGNVFFKEALDENDWSAIFQRLEDLRHAEELLARAQSFSQTKFLQELREVLALDTHD